MWPRSSRRRWICTVAACGLLAIAIGLRPDRALRTATGMAAHDLCSETFVAGLDPELTFAESIAPRAGMTWLSRALRYRVDREAREVRVSLLGAIPSRAIHRGEWGCVLVHGQEAIPRPSPVTVSMQDRMPSWVATDVPATPGSPALDAVLDAAFAEPERSPHRRTRAVVILRDGRIVAERYAPGYDADTPMLGFSMTKSVMNALVGVLVQEGRLDVQAPVPMATGDARDEEDAHDAVTLEHLMRMNSGLALDETGSGFDPSNQMFYDEPDMAAYAMRARTVARPGVRWAYSSASTHLVARVVRDRVGGSAEAVQAFARQALFQPLGMRRVTFEMDATGTPVGGHYLYATARDWARFGQFYLDDGVVDGRRLLPVGWVAWSCRPTPGTAYGAGWWTNRGNDEAAVHRRSIGIPEDACFASGNLGQRLAVIPSQRMVILRLARAHLPHGDAAGFEQLVLGAIEAAGTPR